MNKDTVKGKMKQVKGDLKEKYGKATDDHSKQAEGKLDKVKGKVQEGYGKAKD